MNIRFNPSSNYRQAQPINRASGNIPVRFKGEDEPTRMPEFLKPFKEKEEAYIKKNKMSPLKTAAIIIGGGASLVGLTVATHVFMPVALAGIATFVGGFILVMALFNQVDKPVDLPPGVKPMTLDQMSEAVKYQKALDKYNRSQKIKKIKQFFGLK